MATNTTQIENRIKALIGQVKRGEVTPKDSGVATALNTLKRYDEPAYDKLLAEYKIALQTAQR